MGPARRAGRLLSSTLHFFAFMARSVAGTCGARSVHPGGPRPDHLGQDLGLRLAALEGVETTNHGGGSKGQCVAAALRVFDYGGERLYYGWALQRVVANQMRDDEVLHTDNITWAFMHTKSSTHAYNTLDVAMRACVQCTHELNGRP